MGKKSKKYANTGSVWPLFVKCKNDCLLVGNGEYTNSKGKTSDIVVFATLPKQAPEELQELHKKYWKTLGKFYQKHRKWCSKKDKRKARPVFDIRPPQDD